MIEIPPAALGPSMQSCVGLSEVLSGIALLIRRDVNAEQRDKMLRAVALSYGPRPSARQTQ